MVLIALNGAVLIPYPRILQYALYHVLLVYIVLPLHLPDQQGQVLPIGAEHIWCEGYIGLRTYVLYVLYALLADRRGERNNVGPVVAIAFDGKYLADGTRDLDEALSKVRPICYKVALVNSEETDPSVPDHVLEYLNSGLLA